MSAGVDWRYDGPRILIDVDVLRPTPASDLTAERVTALVDTGASSSGVAKSVAQRLRLPSIGKEPINTAGGTIMSDRYLFRIAFPNPTGFPFVFDDLTGFELTNFSHFQALLGMDVLRRCDFTMRRGGSCSLRF